MDTMKDKKDKKIFAYVDFKFTIPAMGTSEDELIEYARQELYYDSHDILKDMRRYGGTVAESFDKEEAEDYGMLNFEEEE